MQFPEKIGTPLAANAIKVMLLGSGELGKEVIMAFQRLGVEVIAVDRYPNAPGHHVAHRFHVIDMTNAAQLKALIAQEKPHIVVPEIEAIATPALKELEAEGVVRVVPTANAAWLTMNREGIRRLAAEELSLACSHYAFADDFETLKKAVEIGLNGAAPVGYPCIIKPVMSSSGKGQSKVDGPHELQAAWDYAGSAGRVNAGRVIVESVIHFDYEITLLTVRSRNPVNKAIETSYCEPVGHIQVSGDYVESWQPQAMSPKALEAAKAMADKVTTALGGTGLFGVEMFVKGDVVWFSEVSPRPHDTGMVTMITQWQNEFELHARAILGLPTDTSLKSPGASAVIYGGMDKQGIAFEGVADALAEPGTDLRLFGKPESFLKRRMGVALARDPDVEQARLKAKRAAAKVKPVAS
ncbi:formate-dependent phosphoribosylglycinamide formyltransferase [Limnobacter humi]|uniref:Formate-dependent phosphoribosylglycinamide formyltransferase n=1 Tax=Limnobacter humi TaxID=1778671 RepID=A0ABT1WEL8_9BURK|nr:formate-dependent phosphoribosylglycinamide formyltransferase [Limnobacter humi]